MVDAVLGLDAERDVVLDGIARRAAAHDLDGSFPFEAFPELWSLGLLNLTIPAEIGGAGLGLAASTAAVTAVGAADPSVALIVAQHLTTHNNLRIGAWPADVVRMVQQSSVEGVALINSLRVEPDLGSPARGGLPATVAERLPGAAGWRLTGHKIYSTGIPLLRWMLVWARTDDDNPLVGTFLVDSTTSTHRVERTWDPLGMRATRSDDVFFEGVLLPQYAAVDLAPAATAGAGINPVFGIWNTVLMAAVYHGIARSARDWLGQYLNERTPSNLGAPLASLPRFHEAFGRIEVSLANADRLLRSMADDVDAGGDPSALAVESMGIKHHVTNAAITAVMDAVGLVGNPGMSRARPLERHLRNVLHGPIHTPQDDAILATTGRSALHRAAAMHEPGR
jgi:alkylation response protein AidB-like acyl-CoA dehydrogenase